MANCDSAGLTVVMREGATCFRAGERTVARLAAPLIEFAEPNQQTVGVRWDVVNVVAGDDIVIDFAADGWTAMDRLIPVAPGQYRCHRTWRNSSSYPQDVTLGCELQHPGTDAFCLIPAVSYDGNHWGHGQEPKGFADISSSPPRTWVFGGDRTSIPGCTISESDDYVVALHADPADAHQCACALAPATGMTVHQLWWPLQETPRSYRLRDTYGPAVQSSVTLPPGASFTRTFFLIIKPCPEPRQGYSLVLDDAWTNSRHNVPARYTSQQLWELGIRFTKESLWVETDEFVGFSIGLILQDGQWTMRPKWRYEIGWCGQNASLATMLLQDFLWHGHEDSWNRGAKALDHWANHGRFDNGLFYTHFDEKLAGNANPSLDTCNLGHGAYFYLLASQLAEKAKRPHALWRRFGLDACDFFTRHILPNGKLGKVWKADGQIEDPDGTVGCSMVWPLCKAFRITGNTKYVHTAERAYRAYADDDLAQMRCTAGALDTDCIDKETAFPLLVAGLDLYEITRNDYYLRQAERAAYYLASWQWHYRRACPAHTAWDQMAYDTFGGTSVSVQHHHLDPWAALIALGWLRLSRATGRAIWRERAVAAWRQAAIGLSDGSLSLQGVVRPAGGQDEGFYHTRWGGEPGSVSNWLVAWPTAFRLVTLQHWPQWSDLD